MASNHIYYNNDWNFLSDRSISSLLFVLIYPLNRFGIGQANKALL